MAAAGTSKLWFALFRCPRCGHYERHAYLVASRGKSLYWCPECSSYFSMKSGWIVGLGWGLTIAGIGGAALWISVVMLGPRVNLGWAFLAAYLVTFPALMLLWPVFVRRFIRYDYVGKNAP